MNMLMPSTIMRLPNETNMNPLQILLDSLLAAANRAKTIEDYDIYMNLHHEIGVQIRLAEGPQSPPQEDSETFAS